MTVRLYLAVLTVSLFTSLKGPQAVTQPSWIWGTSDPAIKAADGPCIFTKTVTLTEPVQQAILNLTCDNQHVVRPNHRLIAADEGWQTLDRYDFVAAKRTLGLHLGQGRHHVMPAIDVDPQADQLLVAADS